MDAPHGPVQGALDRTGATRSSYRAQSSPTNQSSSPNITLDSRSSAPSHSSRLISNRGFEMQSHFEITRNMQDMERHLSKQTHVRIQAKPLARSEGLREIIFNGDNTEDLRQLSIKSEYMGCFVNRFIITPSTTDVPKDVKRLRISSASLRWLTKHFNSSPHFIKSMLNCNVLPGLSSRHICDRQGARSFTCWYTLHVRVVSDCLDEEGNHALSASGSNQLDPCGYLHLGRSDLNKQQDIRSSKIGIYCCYASESCALICIDFQDGRLYREAGEPYERLKEMVTRVQESKSNLHPLDIHIALLSTVMRWWQHTLSELKGQLIYFERHLIEESLQEAVSSSLGSESTVELLSNKKTLHSIQSHLRSKNEHIDILLSEIDAIAGFRQELQHQAEVCLDLLGQVIRWRNDMAIVHNSKLTRKLLTFAKNQNRASQSMMRESHQIAKDTSKDSVSMKAIAVLTLAFLPATSFAAILAMPFFSQQEYLDDPTKIWIWIVLTVPTTLLALLIYIVFTKRALRTRSQVNDDFEEMQMESVDFILDE